jgi:hypothetical protein
VLGVTTQTFEFRFAPAYRVAGLPFGVTPGRAQVTIDDEQLTVRFGVWRLQTPLANIAATSVTGPYAFVKTAGPAHLSFTDRGMTCATNGERGLCIRFHDPVRGIEPTGALRHPGVTVTVADVEGLSRALQPPTPEGARASSTAGARALPSRP